MITETQYKEVIKQSGFSLGNFLFLACLPGCLVFIGLFPFFSQIGG